MRDLVDHRLDRKRHGADEDRQARVALHQSGASLGVIKPVAGIMGLGDDRIERGAIKRCVHLVGDLHQAAVEHRQCHGIERPRHRFPAVRVGLRLKLRIALAPRQHFRRADQPVEPVEVEHAGAERLGGAVRLQRAVEFLGCLGERAHDGAGEDHEGKAERLKLARRQHRSLAAFHHVHHQRHGLAELRSDAAEFVALPRRLDEQHVGASLTVERGARHGAVEALDGDGVGPRDDHGVF